MFFLFLFLTATPHPGDTKAVKRTPTPETRNKKVLNFLRNLELNQMNMVRTMGLEPIWLVPYAPQTYASANSATTACQITAN